MESQGPLSLRERFCRKNQEKDKRGSKNEYRPVKIILTAVPVHLLLA